MHFNAVFLCPGIQRLCPQRDSVAKKVTGTWTAVKRMNPCLQDWNAVKPWLLNTDPCTNSRKSIMASSKPFKTLKSWRKLNAISSNVPWFPLRKNNSLLFILHSFRWFWNNRTLKQGCRQPLRSVKSPRDFQVFLVRKQSRRWIRQAIFFRNVQTWKGIWGGGFP